MDRPVAAAARARPARALLRDGTPALLVPPGDELLVGAVHDPAAGAVVALGPGGWAAGALGHRLAPLSDVDAREMLAATGPFGTAHGSTLDLAGVADCLRRVAWLADTVPEVPEVDLNPLVVTGRGCAALDVRVRLSGDRPAPAGPGPASEA